MDDHYATLQVRTTASLAEIERAYRRLARANHPDLLREATPEVRRRAEERLKRINVAHGILSDRERRQRYDQERALHARRATPRPTRPPTASTPARRPPVAERTSHWTNSGPIDLEWTTPPRRTQRPSPPLFTTKHLLWYALATTIFLVLVLTLLWRPLPLPQPLPNTPTVLR